MPSASNAYSILLFVAVVSCVCIQGSLSFCSPTSRCIRYHRPTAEDTVLKESRMNILDMEKEVVASARLKMDQRKIVESLDTTTSTTSSSGNNKKSPEKAALLAPAWQISAAAGISAFVGCECITHNNFLSMIALTVVFVSALKDPVDDEGLFGAISRILGRATIQTVESSKPRLKRIAKAAIIDDEDDGNNFFSTDRGKEQLLRTHQDPRLVRYIQQLEEENASLSRWKEQRQLVDQYLPYYSMDDLQAKARQYGIDIACTKTQLMLRLLEADIIQLH
eukprot:scaffold24174_cov117-Cylindrotheca_fusiformis.AAC.7